MVSRRLTPLWLFPLLGMVAAACGTDAFNKDPGKNDDPGEAPSGSAPAGVFLGDQREARGAASLRAAYVQAVQNTAAEEYAIDRSDKVLRASNRSQRLLAEFDKKEVRVAPLDQDAKEWRWSVGAMRWGCTDALSPVASVEPETSGNRIEYRHADLTEWYVNGPLGVEQGFQVPEAPACRRAGGGELAIELGAPEGLTPKLVNEGREAVLEDADGETVVRYTDLYVSDATGKILPARLGLEAGRLSIRIDDAGAVYPLMVDPLIASSAGKILAPSGTFGDKFGSSIALSGSTAIIGAPQADGNTPDTGAAYVFVRSGSSWAFQAKLSPPDGASGDSFGASVAIDADTAVVGAPYNDINGTDAGATYVFVRSATTWALQTRLVPSTSSSNDLFGRSVGVSGNQVIAGGYKARIFGRDSNNAWSQEFVSNETDSRSVAISGGTAVVVGVSNNWHMRVYSRQVSAWWQEVSYNAAYSDSTVAIQGNTIVHGRPSYSTYNSNGAVWVFDKNSAGYGQGTMLPSPLGTASNIKFGNSVAVHEGKILVGSLDSAYYFSSISSTPQQLVASNGVTGEGFGAAVALTNDQLLIGAPDHVYSGGPYGGAHVFSLKQTNGEACTASSECASGFCVDGFCCDTACTGTCSACSAALKGSGTNNGTCGPILSGSDPQDECTTDAALYCGNTGVCNGAGACQKYSENVCQAASCSGSTLTNPFICNGSGSCVNNGTQSCAPYACSGSACGTSCSTDSQCASGAYCSGSACTGKKDNGNSCTATNQCKSGFCVDGVCCNAACTGGACDACSVAAGAPTNGTCALLTGNSCNDGNECTKTDTCQSGVCTGSNPVTCPADQCRDAGTCNPTTGACSYPAKPNGLLCNDGNECTNPDTCQSGVCQPGAPKVCTPGQCQENAGCNATNGACIFAPAPNGTPCPGGTCQSGACVVPVSPIVAFAAGTSHSLALRSDGTLFSWGSDANGQLGAPGSSTVRTKPGVVNLPVPVLVDPTLTTIAAGGRHSLAVLADGSLAAWGYDFYGQLGNDAAKVDVTEAPSVFSLPGGVRALAVAAGANHSLVLDENYQVWSFGINTFGQLGKATASSTPTSPIADFSQNVIVAIAAGTDHSYALDANGVVWAWGRDAAGQLGDGATTTTGGFTPREVSLPQAATAITSGNNHGMALLGDGSVYTWGSDSNGQLGDGGTFPANQFTPVKVTAIVYAYAVAAGGNHSLVHQYDGTITSFGQDSSGQLGNDPAMSTQMFSPVTVAGGASHEPVFAAGGSHSLLKKNDDTYWAAGSDQFGQLGNDAVTVANQPVPVPFTFSP